MMRAPSIVVVLLVLVGCQRAAPPVLPEELFAVEFLLSTNHITVGDLVTAELTLVHPPRTRFEVPEPVGVDSPWLIRNRSAVSQTLDEARVRTVYRYVLTSFQLGEHAWPTGNLRFLIPEGEAVERPLPEAILQVISVLSDEDQGLSPNKPLLDWPDRVPRWIPVLVGIALMAMLLAVLAAYLLRRRQAGDFRPPPPPPDQLALLALTALKQKGYVESRLIDPFYLEVSSIVRRYLEDRFQLRAPEYTTEEFIRDAVQSRLLTSVHQQLVEHFLMQCDLVKFAKAQPGEAEMNEAFMAAWRLVDETRPVEEATAS